VIPPTIIVTGDKDTGYKFKKFALNQLAILERLMSFQGLNEGFRTVKPCPGIVVECWSSFSIRVVKVHVIGETQKQEGENKEKNGRECFCSHHFAMGEVLKVIPEYPEKNIHPTTGLDFSESVEAFQARITAYQTFLNTERFQYDLAVCLGYGYITFLDAYDTNFGRYYKGQLVLVTLGDTLPDGTTDCERTCLLDQDRFEYLAISPLHLSGLMRKWLRGE